MRPLQITAGFHGFVILAESVDNKIRLVEIHVCSAMPWRGVVFSLAIQRKSPTFSFRTSNLTPTVTKYNSTRAAYAAENFTVFAQFLQEKSSELGGRPTLTQQT